MRVRGGRGLDLLKTIGEAIDRMEAANPGEEVAEKHLPTVRWAHVPERS